MPNVELYFNSEKIEGWTALVIKQSVDQLCGVWSGSFPHGVIDWQTLNDQTLVTILIDERVEFQGFIEKFNTMVSEKEAVLELAGRSIICDLVDSSISDELKTELSTVISTQYENPIEYLNYITERVVHDIYLPFTPPNIINLIAAKPTDILAEEMNIETATKGYNIINNIAKKMGVTITSTETGNLMLYRPLPVNATNTPSIVKSLRATSDSKANVLTGSLSYDTTDCYFVYKLVGDDGQMLETFARSVPVYTRLDLNKSGQSTSAANLNDPFSTANILANKFSTRVFEFDTQTYTQPIIKTDERFRKTRSTEIKIDGNINERNLGLYLDNEMSRRVSESLKYKCEVLGTDYRCRDYVQIEDEMWGFNALFMVQSRTLNISSEDINSSLVCVSANTYTVENAEQVMNNAEVEINRPRNIESVFIPADEMPITEVLPGHFLRPNTPHPYFDIEYGVDSISPEYNRTNMMEQEKRRIQAEDARATLTEERRKFLKQVSSGIQEAFASDKIWWKSDKIWWKSDKIWWKFW